jgi:hypothetical protein
MKFLEKNLEDIIYQHPAECYHRGLNILAPGQSVQLLRQVPLGPYGTADLVSVIVNLSPVYAPWEESYKRCITVRVIECKLGEINAAAYLQAKRYITALKLMLEEYNDRHTEYVFETVLIGRNVDTDSDFIYQYMDDDGCTVYTYDYGFDGISFERETKNWRKGDGTTDAMHSLAQKTILGVFRKAKVNCWNKDLPEALHHPYKD